MTEIKWEVLEEDPEKYRCPATRGPKSKIQCEVHKGHNDSHAGRDKIGRWYFW